MLCPAWVTLRLETVGLGAPVGQAVTNPGRVAFVAVRFKATALTPVAGTPAVPATCTSIEVFDPTGPAGAPRPVRVSRMRVGVSGTNFPALAGAAAPAVSTASLITVNDDNSAVTATNTK